MSFERRHAIMSFERRHTIMSFERRRHAIMSFERRHAIMSFERRHAIMSFERRVTRSRSQESFRKPGGTGADGAGALGRIAEYDIVVDSTQFSQSSPTQRDSALHAADASDVTTSTCCS